VQVYAEDPEPGSVETVEGEIDWPIFWQTFKQYAQWDLEWHDGSEWVSVKEDLDVQLSYPQLNTSKINLVFDASHSGNYRLTFAINKVVKDYAEKIDKYQYELTYDDVSIIFDWSDCANISGLVFSHGIKDNLFWFRIRRDNVPLGAHVEIDPATIATPNYVSIVSGVYQRNGFYASGRFWVFYSTGSNAYYESSTDGTTWSGAVTGIGYGAGWAFSVCYDVGTDLIHYSRYQNRETFYRAGTPETDGTITWITAEYKIYDGTSDSYYTNPSISVDSEGYAWIGLNRRSGSSYWPYVWKNANNDGTWSKEFGWRLHTTSSSLWRVIPVPLTDGKVYTVYAAEQSGGGAYEPKGQLYDDGFGDQEAVTADYLNEHSVFSATALGDDVHFVYNYWDAIKHVERPYSGSWGSPTI
ncbi:unnamed protein product, partial [marine sediment metagenome]